MGISIAWRIVLISDLLSLPVASRPKLTTIGCMVGEEEMVSRWARPATVLNSYSLLTGLRQRAVNAGCMFASFITLPYHCLQRAVHESCSRKAFFEHNAKVIRGWVQICEEVAEEVIRFHSRRQFNCSWTNEHVISRSREPRSLKSVLVLPPHIFGPFGPSSLVLPKYLAQALWSSQNVFGPPTAGSVVVDFKDRDESKITKAI